MTSYLLSVVEMSHSALSVGARRESTVWNSVWILPHEHRFVTISFCSYNSRNHAQLTTVTDTWHFMTVICLCNQPSKLTEPGLLFVGGYINFSHVLGIEWQFCTRLGCVTSTIRYDSGYLTCSKKLTGSQPSLPHGTGYRWLNTLAVVKFIKFIKF